MASLLKLCCKEVETAPLMPSNDASPTPSIDVSTKPDATNSRCRKFNIRTLDKTAIVMELVGEMKSPEKAPVRQQLLGGSDVTVQSLNNTMKKYIHLPQCIDGHSADMALRKN